MAAHILKRPAVVHLAYVLTWLKDHSDLFRVRRAQPMVYLHYMAQPMVIGVYGVLVFWQFCSYFVEKDLPL